MSISGLSILIPVYNYDTRALVRTIHKQAIDTGIAFEIILMEDASTLFLAENKKTQALSHVFYSVSEKNTGRAATRNRLAEKSKYDWILFLDADVLPVSENFIANYIITPQTEDHKVVCGGLAYKNEKPEKAHLLRWKYGKEREEQSVEQRTTSPHFITSANVMYPKKIFFELNTALENYYGDDLIISQNIKKKKLEVVHINNPVYHLGLETSSQYLQKAKKAVEFVYRSEKDRILDPNFMGFQRVYAKLNKIGITSLVLSVVGKFENTLKKNLLSENPSLFYFDLYRLLYFLKLKKENNV